MSTDLDRVLEAFPGSEVVADDPGSAPVAPVAPPVPPRGGEGRLAPASGPVGELVAAVDAMVEHFRVNEPARLERPGWQRIVAALDAAAYLPDPSAPGVQLRSGASDTETAAAWAALPGSGTQRRDVLDALSSSGDAGLCDHEIAEALSMNPSSVRPRRGELVSGGWVEDSGLRRRTPSGADAAVWVVSEAGRRSMRHPA